MSFSNLPRDVGFSPPTNWDAPAKYNVAVTSVLTACLKSNSTATLGADIRQAWEFPQKMHFFSQLKWGHVKMHVFACGPKTVLVKRTFLKNAISEVRLGWGGVGHVNVPCTSYIIVCYAAGISGIVATLLVTMLQGSLVLLLRDMILRC